MEQKTSSSQPKTQKRGVQFPWKLHQLLDECEKNGDDNVVSWLPDGKAFKVHEKNEFSSRIMPTYFNSTKHKTFQRSLNLWGFEKINTGPDKGACYHPYFLRGKPDLCHSMTRVKIKGTGETNKSGGIKHTTKPSPPGINSSGQKSENVATSMHSLAHPLPALPSSLLSLPTRGVTAPAQSRASISDFIRSSGTQPRNTDTQASLVAETNSSAQLLRQLKMRNDALEAALATTQSTMSALTGTTGLISPILTSSLGPVRRQSLLGRGVEQVPLSQTRNTVYEAAIAAALANNIVQM